MPQQRVKRKFKDISMSFETNPLNDDLVSLSDTSAIARSIRNIVFTSPGEKFFQPDFGSRVSESLFENVDEVSALSIRDEIRSSIINYEPRVKLNNVNVNLNPDENEINLSITYEIVGVDIPPQQLDFVLLPTR